MFEAVGANAAGMIRGRMDVILLGLAVLMGIDYKDGLGYNHSENIQQNLNKEKRMKNAGSA